MNAEDVTPPPKGRGRKPLPKTQWWPAGMDGRSKAAQEIARIAEIIARSVDNPDDEIMRLKIKRLSQLYIVAENLRAKSISGRKTDIDKLAKLENSINRLQREVLIKKSTAATQIDLKSYLSARNKNPD